MLFASSFSDGFLGVIMLVGFGMWGASKLGMKYDTDGRIKEAAKGGIIRMIGRLLK